MVGLGLGLLHDNEKAQESISFSTAVPTYINVHSMVKVSHISLYSA
jgi:hypothetical protein